MYTDRPACIFCTAVLEPSDRSHVNGSRLRFFFLEERKFSWKGLVFIAPEVRTLSEFSSWTEGVILHSSREVSYDVQILVYLEDVDWLHTVWPLISLNHLIPPCPRNFHRNLSPTQNERDDDIWLSCTRRGLKAAVCWVISMLEEKTLERNMSWGLKLVRGSRMGAPDSWWSAMLWTESPWTHNENPVVPTISWSWIALEFLLSCFLSSLLKRASHEGIELNFMSAK